MTDKELLELAARAAGIELDCTIRPDGEPFYHSDRNAFAAADGGWFAALTDDGDALRLLVKLGLFVHAENDRSRTQAGLGPLPGLKSVDHGSDPLAATRRAIVRAAAEIGKNMQ